MWIVRLALRRTYTFVVMVLLIGVFGAVSIYRMSTDILFARLVRNWPPGERKSLARPRCMHNGRSVEVLRYKFAKQGRSLAS